VAVLTLAAAALAATTIAVAEPAEITEKRAEAEAVLDQIQQIDAELGLAVEAYNSATLRLEEIEGDIALNQNHLTIAKRSYRAAQKHLAARVVALYTAGDQDVLEVLLGSASLDDMLDRVDSIRRISALDIRIVGAVEDAREEIKARAGKLRKIRGEQRRMVAKRDQQRAAIEAKLAERNALYASIEDQIVQLVAEEEERQRRLAEEARQRREAERQAAAAEAAAIAENPVAFSEEVPVAGTGNAPPAQYGGVVDVALQFLGVPYVWGGASPSGFDCSGLVVYAYGQLGVSLPHYTGSLWQVGIPVSREELQAGDLVFFNGLGHVGIYMGGGQFVHAPHTGDVVKISSLYEGWYAATYVGARRI
jgi:cell wall-associated NlpC family hydrolase